MLPRQGTLAVIFEAGERLSAMRALHQEHAQELHCINYRVQQQQVTCAVVCVGPVDIAGGAATTERFGWSKLISWALDSTLWPQPLQKSAYTAKSSPHPRQNGIMQ